jgi:hypothetical protein
MARTTNLIQSSAAAWSELSDNLIKTKQKLTRMFYTDTKQNGRTAKPSSKKSRIKLTLLT